MKLKQKLYDLLASHKAKVGEARTAVESGDLDRAEELTREAQDLAGEIEKVKALMMAVRVSPRAHRRGCTSSRSAAEKTAIRRL